MIRRMAGLGVANLTVRPPYRDKQYLFCDVAIIGAGPAGLSAALEAAATVRQVLLIDENPTLGGSLTYHRFDISNTVAQTTLSIYLLLSLQRPIFAS